jgi:hypothetical protein
LWQKFNLLRLYCQYREENKDAFYSIKGYEILTQVVNRKLFILCHEYYSSSNDAKEVCKEVARTLDVIGLKESDLLSVPAEVVWALVHILSELIEDCEHLKLQGMVLRIYRLMFSDYNIDYNLIETQACCSCVVEVALHMLRRENGRDVTNEDLFNGTAILDAAWTRNRKNCLVTDYVYALVNVVIICVSRFQDLHAAATTDDAQASSNSNSIIYHENNIKLISIGLDRGLSLINSLLTDASVSKEFFCECKLTLQNLDIVTEIVRIVKLVLAGCKFFYSLHLIFGITIAAALDKEEGGRRRNDVVEAFGDLFRSTNVDEFGTEVKLLLQDIMRDGNAYVALKIQ